jgi:hypothetical protein
MHWTTYRHIPGDAPEKPTRPQARQANSAPDAAYSRYMTTPATRGDEVFARWPFPSRDRPSTLKRLMHIVQRPRHYVSPVTLTAMRPVLRYSSTRDAFVLRMVGDHRGPVLRRERRTGPDQHLGEERRQSLSAT